MKYIFKYGLGAVWYFAMIITITMIMPIYVVTYIVWEFKLPDWTSILDHSCNRFDIPKWHWFLSNEPDYKKGESGSDMLIFKSYYHYVIGEVKQVIYWSH